MVDFGRLKSPLSDPELINKMIRELRESQILSSQQQQAVDRGDFVGFLNLFKQELDKIDDVAEKTKVRKVRLEEKLKAIDTSLIKHLNSYRRKLKKVSKKDPSAKKQLEYVESLLAQIRTIKDQIKDEVNRSVSEERKVYHNI